MYHMRVKVEKPLALLLALMLTICQPAMIVLAAETGPDDSPDTPFELSQASPENGDAVKQETESQLDETVTEQSQPEPLAGGEEGIPEPEEHELEESQPEEPEPSQPESGWGEEETSEPEKPEEPKPERPEESQPKVPEPELPEEFLPEVPELELPAIPLPEVEEEVVEEQEPVIKTAPLGVSRFQVRIFGMAPFSAGDGSVAKLVADNHVIMMRADGRLLVWGDNTYGQLGLGPGSPQKVYEPTENTFFKDKPIKDIAVIEDATFVLLQNGELYAFGKGTNGRLGLGSNTNAQTPTMIPGSPGLQIKSLYPMKESMVVVTENNSIYTWGRNNRGQLGDGTKVDKNIPTRIIESVDVKSLHVGDDYVIVIKQDNTLLAWGNNENGVFPYDGKYKVIVSNKGTFDYTAERQFINVGNPRGWNKDPSAKAKTEGVITNSQPNQGDIQILEMDLAESLVGVQPDTGEYVPISPDTYTDSTNPVMETEYANWDEYNITYTLTGSTSVSRTSNKFGLISFSGSGTWSGQTGIKRGNDNYSFKTTASRSANWSLEPNSLDFSDDSVISNITHLMTGSKHWYMINDGQLYSQGANSLNQQSTSGEANGYLSTAQKVREYVNNLESNGDPFSELVVHRDTNYIITTSGNVHAWGGNTSGKTGTGLTSASVDIPTSVYALNNKNIASIVPGRNMTLFVSHTGDVYAVGDNSHGQLGLGDSYKSKTSITTPEKIETFKFSETELPPDAPENVEAPEEVEAGHQITIKWKAANKAVAYELQRTVSLKEDADTDAQMFTTRLFAPFGASLMSDLGLEVSEVVYNGEETQYKDTAQSNWETVTYSVKALNSIGDYSPEITTKAIAIKAGSGGNTNPTDDTIPPTLTITTDAASKTIHITAIDTESGMEGIYVNHIKRGIDSASYVISVGETVAIYGKDNAGNTSPTRMISYTDVVGNSGGNNNNGGGLTDEQLLLILTALKNNKSNGIDSDAILALATALRRNNPVVNNNTGVDESLVQALIEMSRNSGTKNTSSQESIRYVQTGNSTQNEDPSSELLSFLLSQLQGSESAGNGSNSYDLLSAFLLIKLLTDEQDTQQLEYSPAPQGTSMAVGIAPAVLTVIMVLLSVAFPLTVFYFNRKIKGMAGSPGPKGAPDDGIDWKEKYNETAREYNELVDMITRAEQSEEVAQAQE